MAKFYSASTGGFYSEEIHGDNMPSDVVEISDERYAELMEAQDSGKVIKAGKSGEPEAADQAPPTDRDAALAQIYALEASVTPRRLREAVLTTAGAEWLASLDAQIKKIREKLA